MLTIIEESSLGAADTQLLYAGLLATDPPAQPRRYAPLVLTVRDDDGRLRCGLLAATLWGWLSIDVLWVDGSLRRQGYGRRIMQEAESLARARGCRGARLDTFDFQAREFYERLGYRVYAELPGFPEGHTQFHLAKDLGPVG